jgi:hypothetical protein
MAKKVAGTKDDPTIRFASITIDETEYKLAYSFAAIAKAEKPTGCNLLSGMVSVSNILDTGFPGASVVLGMFWAALSVAHPDMTWNDAAVLIRPDTVADIWHAVQEAQALSRKDYEPEKKSVEPEPEVKPSN